VHDNTVWKDEVRLSARQGLFKVTFGRFDI
jgi:hypothetical protein